MSTIKHGAVIVNMIYIIKKITIFFVIITAMFLCVGGTPAVAVDYHTDNTASTSGGWNDKCPFQNNLGRC